MRRTCVSITLAWMTLWLVVIMPGHTRGVIEWVGATPQLAEVANVDACCAPKPAEQPTNASCCTTRTPDTSEGDSACDASDTSKDTPTDDPASRCALCKLRVLMGQPLALTFDPPAFLYAFDLAPVDVTVAIHPLAAPASVAARPPPSWV